MDRRRYEGDWTPLVFMGLTALLTMLRGRESVFGGAHAGREARWWARHEAREARWEAREARREARRRARNARWEARGDLSSPAPFKPLFTVIGLVGAFVALGVLLTVLSAVAALGGGGALAVSCGVPALLVAFVAWMIKQSRPKESQVPAESDPWTYEGTAREAASGSRANGAETFGSATAAAEVPVFTPRPEAPRQAPATKPQPVPSPHSRAFAGG